MSVDATHMQEASPEVNSNDESLAIEMRDHSDHTAYVALLDSYALKIISFCQSLVHRTLVTNRRCG